MDFEAEQIYNAGAARLQLIIDSPCLVRWHVAPAVCSLSLFVVSDAFEVQCWAGECTGLVQLRGSQVWWRCLQSC